MLTVTPGAENADSYLTVQEATEYLHANTLNYPVWTVASLQDQEAALRWATRLLDNNLTWEGAPTNPQVQALQHPRMGLVDKFGNVVPDDVIMSEVKWAEAELALYLIVANPSGIPPVYDYVKLGDGLVFSSKSTSKPVMIPPSILNLVSHWSRPIVGTAQVRLRRC